MNDSPKKAPHAESGGAFAFSIASLSLSHFRNYESFRLDTAEAPVVLTGTNGIGKTNVLEALSLLAPGRGLRGARPQELAEKESEYPWAVSAKIRTRDGIISIGTGRDPLSDSDTRIVKVNGQKERGQTSLSAHVSLLWLAPQMDQTLSESPATRRQFLDNLTGIFFPDHSRQLNLYEHAKSERKRLLYDRRADSQWIAALEQRMAEQAVAIAAARLETMSLLEGTMAEGGAAFPKASLAISGSVESALTHGSAAIAEQALADELSHSRELDRESGKTNFGTHRSDFLVHHQGRQMPASLCSTGEQKALLLSLTLAAARAKARRHRTIPILLLDEVVAHLDESRRAALFDETLTLRAQCWLTGTDASFFRPILPSATHVELPLTT